MAFTFLRSYQPDTEHPDDEEEDEMPMARSGRVRAFSHLPDRAAGKEPDAPPPQVGVGRSGGMRPARPMPANEEADEVTDAPPMLRSGSVRAFSHLPDSTEGEDDEGAHQPPGPAAAPQARGQGESPGSGFAFHPPEQDNAPDPAPSSATDSPLDGRNPTARGAATGAAVPGFAAGSTGMTGLPKNRLFEQRLPPGFRNPASDQSPNVAATRDARLAQSSPPPRPANAKPLPPQTLAQSSKPGAQAPASKPVPVPGTASQNRAANSQTPLTHKDLHIQDLDDDAVGSHSLPESRPKFHELMYRTHGESPPQPAFSDLVYRTQGATRNVVQAPDMHMVQLVAKNKAPVQSQQREDEPSHDRDFTAEQQKKFIEAMKKKALDLYHHHENRVGERTPAAATAKRDGKIVAYCNQYPSECVAAGYEAIGMPKTAQMIRDKTTKRGQSVQHLAKVLHDRGWKSIFYNNDRTSPGSKGEHANDTGMVEKSGLYWAPPRMGSDEKLKTDWMKVDGHMADFRPGRPGYSNAVTEDLKKVEFGVVAGCRGNHGAVMSNGGTYDVHRSEPDVNHLYGKTDFNQAGGFLQSGLLLIPPGGHIPSHTPTK